MTDQDRAIWKAGYDVHVKYGEDGPATDEQWNSLAEDCRDIYTRFGNTDFAFRMGLMMLEYYGDRRKHRTHTTE